MKRHRSVFFMLIFVVFIDLFSPVVTSDKFQGRAFRINPQPCSDRHGSRGICMFQWECRRRSGVMLSTCLDRFLFGTCCQLPDADHGSSGGNELTRPQATTSTGRPAANTVDNFLGQSEVGVATSHFVFSDTEFSTPKPVFDGAKNKTTPAYSLPDVDRIFHQFLGSVLANYSKTEAFGTEASAFDHQQSSSTAGTEVDHQQVSSTVDHQQVSSTVDHQQVSSTVDHQQVSSTVDHQQVSSSSSVDHQQVSSTVDHQQVSSSDDPTVYELSEAATLFTSSSTEELTSPEATTTLLSLTELVSQISDYDEYPSGENQTIATPMYDDTPESVTPNDGNESWTISGPEVDVPYQPESESQVVFDVVGEVDHSDDMLEGHLGVTTTTEPTTTTTTTATTTRRTTTAKPIVDYKNDPEVEKMFLSLSSWTLWPPSAFLSHLFDAIKTLLGKVMAGSKCLATACQPDHVDPDHDPDPQQVPLTAAASADAFPLQPSEAYCGVRPLIPNGRIVGGTSSKFGEWPWQVLIKEATWLGLFVKNKCGGVLLNHRYVITAAHCQPSFLATLLVVLGENDLSQANDDYKSTQRNVRRVIVHRKFNSLTFDNDVALLELERSVEYRPHIVPICLPADNADFSDKVAIVSGWGRTKYGGRLPTDLQYVDVPIIPNSKCQQMFLAAGHIKAINNKFICAGYREGGKDSCEGDSGGPLVMKGDDDRYVLLGTVSHGIKCAYPNLPGVYIRITAYKSWIEKIINS